MPQQAATLVEEPKQKRLKPEDVDTTGMTREERKLARKGLYARGRNKTERMRQRDMRIANAQGTTLEERVARKAEKKAEKGAAWKDAPDFTG